MTTQRSALLHRYAEDCQGLIDDLDVLLDLLQFEAHGGTIKYAVDFNEIHAYVYPESSQLAPIPIIDSDSTYAGRLAQNFVLERIFFRGPQKWILLPPYLTELETFLIHFRIDTLDATAGLIASAIREASQLTWQVDFQRIVQSLREPLPEDIENEQFILKYLEEHAPALSVLQELADTQPSERLDAILNQDRIESLAELGLEDCPPDKETLDHWYTELPGFSASRPRNRYLDALAMAMLKTANTVLTQRNTRIVLVSRSSPMHSMFEREYRSDRWSNAGGRVLVHPRTLSMLRVVEGLAHMEGIKRLSGMRQSIQAFLLAYRDVFGSFDTIKSLQFRAGDDRDYTYLETLVEGVRRQWALTASLSAAMAGSSWAERPEATAGANSQEQIGQLLRMINDEKRLMYLLKDRMADLSARILQDNLFLGFAVQGGRAGLRSDSRNSKVGNLLFGDTHVLPNIMGSMPCTLQFESNEIKGWFRKMQVGENISLEQIIHGFSVSSEASNRLGDQSNYEPLLFIAYLFGAWNRWQIAETYCDLALFQATNSDEDFAQRATNATGLFKGEPNDRRCPHEGLFFMAVCRRMKDRKEASDYERAWELLHRAAQCKAMLRNDANYRDPRYLKEEAALIMEWHLAGGSNEIGAEVPPLKLALDLSQEALQWAVDDGPLRARIYNNLCYFFVERYREFGVEEYSMAAALFFERLTNVISSLDETRVPPALVDTMTWYRWIIGLQSAAPSDSSGAGDVLTWRRIV